MNILSGWTVLLITAGYMSLLFAIARYGEKRADQNKSLINGTVYALSLAVYCSTWTFFGSVGRASSNGYSFLAIYLGPTLVMLFASVVLKIIRISKVLKLTSIADLLSTRYGKNPWVAGLVTLIAVVGVVPYIALQLKALSLSLSLMQLPELTNNRFILDSSWQNNTVNWWHDTTFWITTVLAIFTLIFGTRHLDVRERHEGMVLAIAFESLVKLIAFFLVGIFVTYFMFDGWQDLISKASLFPENQWVNELTSEFTSRSHAPAFSWLSVLLLSAFAALFLPRQFQVMVVENVHEKHLRTAVWMFPLYLLLINLFVVPIALGGSIYFQGQAVNPDAFVLTLPLSVDNQALALLVFLGGLSAATAMIIVECIALSSMVCNDLVLPVLLRLPIGLTQQTNLAPLIFAIRRITIVLILMLGYVYFQVAGNAYALVDIGLISFAAVAQFAPALFGGLYWRRGNKNGAIAGLIGGFVVWIYTLLLPSFAQSGWINGNFVEFGLWQIDALRAQALFGLSGWDSISHCLFWSMLVNAGLYATVSLCTRQGISEAVLAKQFIDVFRIRHLDAMGAGVTWQSHSTFGELYGLLERFLGNVRTKRAFRQYATKRGFKASNDPAAIHAIELDAGWLRFAESQLAGAIGNASARVMVASVIKEEPLDLKDVLGILDEASQVRTYSQQLEIKSGELLRASAELREANTRLLEVDRIKDDFIATVSHELRTPLTSIRAFSELLLTTADLSDEEQQRFLTIIINEADRLTRLINQVLDMAKLESGRMNFEMDECLIIEVLREVLQSTEAMMVENKLRIRCCWHENHQDEIITIKPDDHDPWLFRAQPKVMADSDHLVQVLHNLIANAVKFSPANGSITVRLSLVPQSAYANARGWAKISIEDEGVGIPAEELDRIFDKFHQSGSKMSGKPRGTGLGLSISRPLIEAMGGKLWAEPNHPHGARFCFTLPLV